MLPRNMEKALCALRVVRSMVGKIPRNQMQFPRGLREVQHHILSKKSTEDRGSGVDLEQVYRPVAHGMPSMETALSALRKAQPMAHVMRPNLVVSTRSLREVQHRILLKKSTDNGREGVDLERVCRPTSRDMLALNGVDLEQVLALKGVDLERPHRPTTRDILALNLVGPLTTEIANNLAECYYT
mmetsp:Transcript_19795/g.32841  ORF Transcript_19795/g.32841 Transcript_19795/m.32841 type:complete len:185 (+) Transcript_19795:2594-3148(+)